MKRKKHLILPLLALLLFSACNNTIYEESHTFPNNTWMRFESEKYQFRISNVEDCYHIVMTATIDTNQFSGKSFPLVINMQSEDGSKRMFYAHIPLTDKNGKRLGTTKGAYQTTSNRVREYLFFNKAGKQSIEVKQGTSKFELKGIQQFGVSIEKAKLDLPK